MDGLFAGAVHEKTVFGLGTVDAAVLVFYLLGITVLGVWMARKVRNMSDFFMPRRFGKAMMIMHSFGTGTHSDQAVSVASKTYSNGLSGIWYQWLWLFVTPFYWLIAPVMRRFRAITTADVFEARYDASVGMLFAVVGMSQLTINIGVMLKGSSAVITACSGGAIDPDLAIFAMTVLFVVYGIAGGLGAAIVTDFVQGILTIVFSFLLLPFILDAVGGVAGMHEKIPAEMFALVAPAEIGLFYIVVIAFNGLVGIVTQPHTMGNCAAGRTEMEGRVGFMGGNMIKRVCTIAWCLTGLAAVSHYAGQNPNPDEIYGMIARDFLPKIAPGLIGVFLASLLASVMSSCDSFMIASSGLFTENFYKVLVRNRSDRHYVFVARVASLAVVAGGVLFAYKLEGVVEGLEIFWKISPMMGIAFWMGLFWRRMNSRGAWASTLAAFGAWWLTTQPSFIGFVQNLECSGSLRLIFEKGGKPEIYLPWQMIFFLSVGALAGVVGSYLGRKPSEEQLENFYALARTPVTPGEETVRPCVLPDGVVPAKRKNLFASKHFEIPRPEPASAVGFLAGWAIVGAIIWVFYAISRG